jgi:hypothetical protein
MSLDIGDVVVYEGKVCRVVGVLRPGEVNANEPLIFTAYDDVLDEEGEEGLISKPWVCVESLTGHRYWVATPLEKQAVDPATFDKMMSFSGPCNCEWCGDPSTRPRKHK